VISETSEGTNWTGHTLEFEQKVMSLGSLFVAGDTRYLFETLLQPVDPIWVVVGIELVALWRLRFF
jgi:hypothetical protein